MIRNDCVRKLLWWSAATTVVIVLAVVIAAIAVHRTGVHRRHEARRAFDADWGHLLRDEPTIEVPEHLNGARWLAAGGVAVICTIDDQKFFGELSIRPSSGWSDAELSRAKWILHEQQHALRILLRSGSFDQFELGRPGTILRHDEIPLMDLIKGIRLLLMEARLARAEGRYGDGAAALVAAGRAADGLLRTRVVIASVLGAAAVRWSASATAEYLADPELPAAALTELRRGLPVEDPILQTEITIALQVDEIAAEGLAYTDDVHDPSMAWSVPFWVASRPLLEDLCVAGIVDRWRRYLELGRRPALEWPADAGIAILNSESWPSWLAMSGTISPNIWSIGARAQAARVDQRLATLALDLLLENGGRPGPDACSQFASEPAAELTGGEIRCGRDLDRGALVIDVPGAERALAGHLPAHNPMARALRIVIPLGRPVEAAAERD